MQKIRLIHILFVFFILSPILQIKPMSVAIKKKQTVLTDRLMIAKQNPAEKYMPSLQEAQAYAEKIGAEVLVCSARELVGNDRVAAGKISKIYFEAKELSNKTGKPVVIIFTDIELVLSEEAHEAGEDALYELFDKVRGGRHHSEIITIYTTSLRPETVNWIIATRISPKDWQIPGAERTEQILSSYRHRMNIRQRNEQERLEKEALKRQEEERRRILEEQEKKRQEELAKKAEELRLSWEKEQRDCPLFREENKRLKERLADLGNSHSEIISHLEKEKLLSKKLTSDNSYLSERISRLVVMCQSTDAQNNMLKRKVNEHEERYGFSAGFIIGVGSAVTLVALIIAFQAYHIMDYYSFKKKYNTKYRSSRVDISKTAR